MVKISANAVSQKRQRQLAISKVKYRSSLRDCTYSEPQDYVRRLELEADTARWLKHYLPESFPLAFADIHYQYISDLDYIAQYGGWKAIALPRGSGKTTIALGFSLKAILTGASLYVVIVSATATNGKENIASLKTWLLFNDRLAADYPEVCEPIRKTGGIPQAMNTVTAHGQSVHMKWTANQIILPDAPLIVDGERMKAPSANAIVECDGITGSLRGRKYDRPDGRTVRPDLAIPDDPQTSESARSPEQTRRRLQIIKSDIAGLAGPGRDIRIVLPCTIMEHNDLADEVTDVQKTPDFLGQRHPFFVSMPTNMDLWHEYNLQRVAGLEARDRGKSAVAFYNDHRQELDKGAMVTWPERKGDSAVNGIQWGMNQYFKLGERAFATEMQNDPIPDVDVISLTKDEVLACETKHKRWVIPFEHLNVFAFIDCNPRTSGLHWAVMAFGEKLLAQVIAYGRYPERGTMVPKGASETEEDMILHKGLGVVCDAFQECRVNDGQAVLDSVLVDGGYKYTTVQNFTSKARYPFQLFTSRGRASSMYSDYGRDVVKSMGHIHLRRNARRERYLTHNADALREIAHRAFHAGPDAPGGCGIHRRPPFHDEFAEHVTSQKLREKVQGKKDILYKWTLIPGAADHWLDCVVGCYAAAHYHGIDTAGTLQSRNKEKKSTGIRRINI